MEYKKTKPKNFLAIILIVLIFFIIGAGILIPNISKNMGLITKEKPKKEDPYLISLKEVLEEKERVDLKEIFHDIDFTYAYVFTDPNLSGEVLTKRYNLDFDLSKVKGLESDSIHRIIFLDENKKHLFTWEYSVYELLIFEGGYYLEADAVIVKENHNFDALVIRFEDLKEENYFMATPEKSQEEFNSHIENITREELIEANHDIDITQFIYGDYFFVVSSEPDDKHQFLYRKKGNDTVLLLYNPNGINSVSLADEDHKLYVSVNTMIDGVLTKIPVIIDISHYNRDMISLDSLLDRQ